MNFIGGVFNRFFRPLGEVKKVEESNVSFEKNDFLDSLVEITDQWEDLDEEGLKLHERYAKTIRQLSDLIEACDRGKANSPNFVGCDEVNYLNYLLMLQPLGDYTEDLEKHLNRVHNRVHSDK